MKNIGEGINHYDNRSEQYRLASGVLSAVLDTSLPQPLGEEPARQSYGVEQYYQSADGNTVFLTAREANDVGATATPDGEGAPVSIGGEEYYPIETSRIPNSLDRLNPQGNI